MMQTLSVEPTAASRAAGSRVGRFVSVVTHEGPERHTLVSEALAAKHRADSPLCVHPFSRSEAAKGNEVSKSRTDACLCRESNFNTLFFQAT